MAFAGSIAGIVGSLISRSSYEYSTHMKHNAQLSDVESQRVLSLAGMTLFLVFFALNQASSHSKYANIAFPLVSFSEVLIPLARHKGWLTPLHIITFQLTLFCIDWWVNYSSNRHIDAGVYMFYAILAVLCKMFDVYWAFKSAQENVAATDERKAQ